MKKFLSKTLVTAAVAAGLGFASLPAVAAFEDFTVDEGSVPGSGAVTFTADKLNGGYSEVITFDGLGGFTAAAFGDFGQYFSNEGATLVVASELNTTYALYTVFSATGTVTDLGGGLFQFTGTTSAFDLFIDPGQDTTKTLPGDGSGAVTLGSNGDDYRIAFASSLESGTGILVSGVGGFFDLVFDDFTLTSGDQSGAFAGDQNGVLYFTAPTPFFFRVNVDGDFDTFAVAGTQDLTGDLSGVFQVPEPGTLALLGISLIGLGLGFGRQRRSA